MAGNDAHQAEGNGHHHHQGHFKGLKPADDQQVDNHQHHRKGGAKIPEYLISDLPFAIPFHGDLLFQERLALIHRLDGVALGKLDLFDLFIHIQHGVDGTLDLSGHIPGNVDHPPQVLAEDAFIFSARFHSHQVADRDHLAGLRAHGNIAQAVDGRTLGPAEAQFDAQRLDFCGHMQQTGIRAIQRNAHGMRQLPGVDPGEGGFFFIDFQIVNRLVVLHHPVDVDHAGSFLKNIADLLRHRHLLFVVRAVDFRHQGREHRRAGGHFGDLHPGAVFVGDSPNTRADAPGDIVTLIIPLRFVQQI